MSTSRIAVAIAALFVLIAVGCSGDRPEEHRPHRAGQPMSAVDAASRQVAVHAAALRGDRRAAQQHMQGLTEDFRRSIRLSDPARSVDRESARAAARRVPGVRSVVWLDHENLFAMVETAQLRSQQTINRICQQLEPLGDTLGVVVNLQNSAARNGRELATLSRNCQLASGERALMSRERAIDPIDTRIRAQHEANQALSEQSEEELARQAEALRVLEHRVKPLQR